MPTGGTHAYPDLEELLPTAIGCRILDTVSLPPDPKLQDPKTLAVLTRLGRTAQDLQFAKASSVVLTITISALRVVGVTGAATEAAFQAVDEAEQVHTTTYGTATIGGKSVSTRTAAGETEYIYATGDAMFVVVGQTDLVAEAISKLP